MFDSNAFYVRNYLGISWVDPSDGSVITLPPDLDSGLLAGGIASNIMFFDSYEIKDISESLGVESAIYESANGIATQQARPKARRWDFTISKINPATDEKIQTLTANQAQGSQPTARIDSGYLAGNAGTGTWTGILAVLNPCAIRFNQLNPRNVGRGKGILHNIELALSIFESVTLTVPTTGVQVGGSGS